MRSLTNMAGLLSINNLTSPITSNTSAPYNFTTIGESFDIRIKNNDILSSLLSVYYKEIRNNYIVFSVYTDYAKNETTPIEDIMRMINLKQVFDFTITRNGYKLNIKEARFIEIKNLIETSANEYIEVEFVYKKMDYDNILKSELQKRSEQIDLLKHKIDKIKP